MEIPTTIAMTFCMWEGDSPEDYTDYVDEDWKIFIQNQKKCLTNGSNCAIMSTSNERGIDTNGKKIDRRHVYGITGYRNRQHLFRMKMVWTWAMFFSMTSAFSLDSHGRTYGKEVFFRQTLTFSPTKQIDASPHTTQRRFPSIGQTSKFWRTSKLETGTDLPNQSDDSNLCAPNARIL